MREAGDIPLHGLQDAVKDAAYASGAVGAEAARKKWDTDELKELRKKRRRCNDKAVRSTLSKEIAKKTRKALRTWQTQRLGEQLEKFRDLRNLDKIAAEPKQRKAATQPPPAAFADMLRRAEAC